MGKDIREGWLARLIEVSQDVAEMNDARRYEVHGGVFKVLVESVIVAVANDSVGNRLGIGNLVVGLPANLTQWVVTATLEWQSRRELEHPLPDRVAKSGSTIPVLALQVVDEGALPPLAKGRNDGRDALAASAGGEQEDRLRT